MVKQLTLGVTLRDDATFANFFSGLNEHVTHHLRQLISLKTENFIYMYGEEGVGISHLLQAACHEAFHHQQHAVYLPLSDPHLTPEVLQDLESIDLVCLDDFESVLGHALWEESLLHFYNRVREQGTRLVIGARSMPAAVSCHLLDLKSRLSWGLVLAVELLPPDEKLRALQMRADHRGLMIPEVVLQFLLRHCSQNMTVLFNALDRLDGASLAEKRKLTLPFVKQILGGAGLL